ncbi:MAG: RNA polymerase sigma factor [Anaerolineales bacterium]|nr:RNA polymerase sigma factor [Anaerolineales bacterium]
MSDKNPQSNVDFQLLQKAALGDKSALAVIYDAYVRPIYRYLYSRVGNAPDAEDLTAQTFLAVLEYLPQYQHRKTFTAWVFQIARNKAMDYFRSNRHVQVEVNESMVDPTQSDILEAVITEECRTRLKSLIYLLDEDERELIRLRYTAELSFVEIAQLLGRKEDAVRKALRRILDRLSTQMEARHV